MLIDPIAVARVNFITPVLTLAGGASTGAGNLRYMACADNRTVYRSCSGIAFATSVGVYRAISLSGNVGQPLNE